VKESNAFEKATMLASMARVEPDEKEARRLARESLATSRLCADAYAILAKLEEDPERTEDLYRQGLEAARTLIGEEGFANEAGRFGETESTRPYLRTLVELIGDLARRGKEGEALLLGRDTLRLNPADPGRLRPVLVGPMIAADRDEEAGELARNSWEDDRDTMAFARALLAFRGSGDSPGARRSLALALSSQPDAVPYVLGELPLPSPDEECGLQEDGAIVASGVKGAFEASPGALEWLAAHRGLYGTASVLLVQQVAAGAALTAYRASVRAVVLEFAEMAGIEARIDYRLGGIAEVRATGDLPQVAELAESLLEEGFFGFVIELERSELAAAFDDLEPEGLVSFVNAQTFTEHPVNAERGDVFDASSEAERDHA
jgi:hypothetical protein